MKALIHINKPISAFIQKHPFAPLLLFGLGGFLTLISIYCLFWPRTAQIVAVLLLTLFVYFHIFLRSSDRVAIGAAGPLIIGPLLVNLWVKHRAPDLQKVLEVGGDILIQLTVFFASLFGAIAYMVSMISQSEDSNSARKATGYFCGLVVVLLICVFSDLSSQKGNEGPPIVGLPFMHFPRLTVLTICRLILGFLSIVLSVWPNHTNTADVERTTA